MARPPGTGRAAAAASAVTVPVRPAHGGAWRLFPRLVDVGTDRPSRVAGPSQERLPAGGCDAWRPRPRRTGPSACRVADGRAGGRADIGLRGAGCITCNQSGWLPGRARGATNDAEVRRVPRSRGAGRAAVAEPGDDAPDATGCSRVHRGASRCNDDAGHATESAASSLHQIQADCEVPGHRSRAARPAGRGHRRAARCAAGSACSRELRNVASDATPRPSTFDPNACRS